MPLTSEREVLSDYLQRIGSKESPEDFLKKLPQDRTDQLLALLAQKAYLREGKMLSRWSFVQNHHANHKLQKLTWHNRDYLRQIYADESKEIAIRKAVQVGVSEWAICDLFYMTMCRNWSGAYIITKTKARDGFVAERINKVLKAVPYYASQVGSVDNLGIKELGKGMARFLGSNAPDDFVSFPADFIIVDEVDLCDQENLSLVPDRLQASEHKFQRWIGNPTIEDFGIDKLYKESDQKVWQIWCKTCKAYYNLDWFSHVIDESQFGLKLRDTTYLNSESALAAIYPICEKCGERMDRFGKGKWEKQNIDSSISGYTLSQIYSSTVTLKEMWDEYVEVKDNPSKLQIFYNNRLGLPFSREGMKVTPNMLVKCEDGYPFHYDYSGSNLVTAGVDVGGYLHVVIREVLESGRKLLYAGTVQNFEDLSELLNRFKVNIMVIDAEPEGRQARLFQQDHFDVVWLADYHLGLNSQEDVSVNKDRQFIRARRTSALDGILEDVITGQFILPSNSQVIYNGEYYDHLCSSTRIQQEEKFVWVNHKADHFLHAESYCRLALQALSNPDIALFSAGQDDDLRRLQPQDIFQKFVDMQYGRVMDFFFE